MKRFLSITLICLPSYVMAETSLNINFQDLLEQARHGRQQDQQINAQRLKNFKQKRAEQTRLLQDVKASFSKQQARTKRLESTFEKNDLLLSELEIELHRQQGRLKELLGTVQQQTNDTLGQFEQSIISAQFPERLATLTTLHKRISDSSNNISMPDIRTLWYETLREIIESGKVTQFTTQVTGSDGLQNDTDVVRIGLFNAVTTGDSAAYLTFNTDNGHLIKLKKQPPGSHTGLLENLNTNVNGIQAVAIDPTRGQLLSALLQQPDYSERLHQGGYVGYVITFLGFIALVMGAYRIFVLFNIKKGINRQVKNIKESNVNNALGRIIHVTQSFPNLSLEDLELKLSEAIHRETPRFTQHHNILKIIAVVAPLLGLLGTVVGMIITFQAITLYGTGDPKLMAGGISSALITTVLGLIVAIPTLFIHNYVTEQSKSLTQTLEQQAIGQLALQANK